MLKINKIKVKAVILSTISIVVFLAGFEFGKCVFNKENVCKKRIEVAVKTDTYSDFVNLREQQNESKLYFLRKAGRKAMLKIIPCKSSFQEKVAYLTFDDGPSQDITPKVLEILRNNNIKATFFIIGKNVKGNEGLVQEEAKEGDTIGCHTFSHDPNYDYSSPDNMIQDIDKGMEALRSVLGSDFSTKFVRLPGGSRGRPKNIVNAVRAKGYTIVDWNCLTGDAEGVHVPVYKLLSRYKCTNKNESTLIILNHDSSAGKETTVQVLPSIINDLRLRGYIFKALGQ